MKPQTDKNMPSTSNPWGFDMKGIRAKGKCPVCQSSFKADIKKGFLCPEHLTAPERFQVDFFYKGERFRREVNLDGEALETFSAAHALLERAKAEIRAKKFDPTKWKAKYLIEYSFDRLIMKWYAEKELLMKQDKRAPSYVPKLKTYINLYYLKHFAGLDVREITAIQTKEFSLRLPGMSPTGRKLSPKYQKNILDALQHFFNWLHDDHIIEQKPKFPKVEVPEYEPKVLTPEVQEIILDIIPEKHKPIFAFLFYQGCRPAEVRALKWKDIDLKNDVVTLRRTFSDSKLRETTKTGRIRHNYLFPETKSALPTAPTPAEWYADEFVFTHGKAVKNTYSKNFLSRIYKKALLEVEEDTGIKIDSSLYDATKHSFGTYLVNEGVPMDVLQKHFGHSNRAMTERYAKLRAVDAMKKAVTKSSPRKKVAVITKQ